MELSTLIPMNSPELLAEKVLQLCQILNLVFASENLLEGDHFFTINV